MTTTGPSRTIPYRNATATSLLARTAAHPYIKSSPFITRRTRNPRISTDPSSPPPSAPRSPWLWVPSLYFAQGLPYVVAMTVSVVMYKRLGISNTDIALYTSWLYLPWVIKPLWSPIVDLVSTERGWSLTMQLAITASLGGVAVALHAPPFFVVTLAAFWVMAFCSATHDIACDGFYMLALPERQQAAFVGIRSTFYRLAMITGQGAFVVLAGQLEQRFVGDTRRAWSITFVALTVLFGVLALWHRVALPRPLHSVARATRASVVEVFVSFFRRRGIATILAFLLLFRFAEAQLVKLVTPFLLDARSAGGLGLTTSEVGVAYGTFGVLALTLGGLLGGCCISQFGLKRMLWICVAAIHLPDLIFVWLAWLQPANLTLISGAVFVEQFGYGFGFTAYMLYMIMVSAGPHRTAHYAICTGIMALGMMVPGMFAGALQEGLGYLHFFVWVMLATIPGFVVAALIRVEPGFGRRGT